MTLEYLKELIDKEVEKGKGDMPVLVFNNNFCSIDGLSYDDEMQVYFIDFELEKRFSDDEIEL